MDEPKTNEAALRVNDSANCDDDGLPEDRDMTTTADDPASDAATVSAEGGPELRDLAMPDGVDRPDGGRRP